MIKKFIISIIILFILLAFATGCKNTLNVNETVSSGDKVYQEEPHSPEEDEETASATDKETSLQLSTGTGTYKGQIDSNFIEIEISGAPTEEEVVVFMLSDELKEKFHIAEPKPDEEIIFEYYINENNQKVIVDIKSL